MIREILLDSLIDSRLFEMAFARKVIIDKLRALQPQINRHAFKIIAWPNVQEVPHWKRELMAWGNDLTLMTMRAGRGLRPMGVDLAWKHLYQEPFDPDVARAVDRLARVIEDEYRGYPVMKPMPQIVTELDSFLKAFCKAIGQGHPVGDVVNALGQTGTAIREAAAE